MLLSCKLLPKNELCDVVRATWKLCQKEMRSTVVVKVHRRGRVAHWKWNCYWGHTALEVTCRRPLALLEQPEKMWEGDGTQQCTRRDSSGSKDDTVARGRTVVSSEMHGGVLLRKWAQSRSHTLAWKSTNWKIKVSSSCRIERSCTLARCVPLSEEMNYGALRCAVREICVSSEGARYHTGDATRSSRSNYITPFVTVS